MAGKYETLRSTRIYKRVSPSYAWAVGKGPTPDVTVQGYEVVPVCSVAEVDNGSDDVSKAFVDEDFPHDERSYKNGGCGVPTCN